MTAPVPALDVFVSYHWRDHEQVERIARALREHGLEPFLDRWYLTPGRPWPQMLEEHLSRCRSAAIFIGADGLGSWQKREMYVALDRQARDDGFSVIPVLLPGADTPTGFLPLNTWVDLRQDGVHESRSIAVLAAAVRGEAPAEVLEQSTRARASVCPYRGLRAFREEDAPFFFGREAVSDELARVVQRSSLVALVGASGSGKSSVARAGLIPRVRRVTGGTTWDVVTLTPGDRPFHALAAQLVQVLESDRSETDRLHETGKLAAHLLDGSVAIRDAVEAALRRQSGTDRLLVVADQWEELYTLCASDDARARFLQGVLDATRDGPLSVVLTLRGDFFGHVLSHRPLSDRLQGSIVNLGPMQRDELLTAIERPAQQVGLGFESGLLDRILSDVENEPGSLPLLEFVLTDLWEHRRAGLLLYDRYRTIGGVHGAVARRAEDVFAQLPAADQELTRRVFLQLVRPGQGTGATRRRATFADVGVEARPVVGRLADAKLLVTDRERATGEETIEVAHEALVRRWDRLARWVDDDREFLLWRGRLDGEIHEFERVGEDAGALLRGAQLVEALRWRSQRSADLNKEESAFVARSEKAQLTEQEAARGRRQRTVAAALVALVGLVALAGVSIAASVEARQQAKNVWAGSVVNAASAVSDPLLGALLLSELAREPEPPGGVTAASRVAQLPLSRVVLRHGAPLNGVAFSPDGEWVATAGMDNTARIWRADGTGEPIVLRGHELVVRGIAFSPDGERVATASADETVRIWQVDGTGEPVILRGGRFSFFGVAFSPDGGRVATGCEDGTTRIWRADGTGEPVILRGHTSYVSGVAFSSDGERLATASKDGTARVWRADGTGEPIILRGHIGLIYGIAFSPDGELVATGGEDGTARIWRADGTGEVAVLNGHTGLVVGVAFSPDGERVATAGSDGTARVWRADGTGEVAVLNGHTGLVAGVAFSPDGVLLATAGEDGTARIWETDGPGEPVVLRGHDDLVYAVAFTPDGERVMTAARDGSARTWQVGGADEPETLGEYAGLVTAAFTPDGERLATAGLDSAVLIRRVDGTGEPTSLRGHESLVKRIEFDPVGGRVATVTLDGIARIWLSNGTGEPVILSGHESSVDGVAFSPDGEQVAVAINDGTARISRVDGAGEPVILRGHEIAVTDVAFSPEGERVATASWDGTARVWRLDGSGQPTILRGHGSTVTAVAFSPGGERVATASGDGTARIWRADGSGEPTILRGSGVWVDQVAFSPDGQRVATGGDDATVRVWRVGWTALLAYLREATTACLTPEQRSRFLGESQATARQSFAACERSFGRNPDAR